MIDVTQSIFSDRIDNNDTREASVFYDLLDEEINKLLQENTFASATYKQAIENEFGSQIPLNVKPHFELQLQCAYGECVADVGYVALGVGYKDDTSATVLDIVDLFPGIDYNEQEVLTLWSKALAYDKTR